MSGVLEYKEIEEVKVRDVETSFFPTGNDVVINNLEKVEVKIRDKGVVLLRGKQTI